jgi:hypothetical protein
VFLLALHRMLDCQKVELKAKVVQHLFIPLLGELCVGKVMDIFLIIFHLFILKFPTFFRIEYRDSIMVFFNWFDSEMTSNQPSFISIERID